MPNAIKKELNFINKYCSDSNMIRIKVYNFSTHQMSLGHYLPRPFSKVKYVYLDNCHIVECSEEIVSTNDETNVLI